jgi:hypothetical protein
MKTIFLTVDVSSKKKALLTVDIQGAGGILVTVGKNTKLSIYRSPLGSRSQDD